MQELYVYYKLEPEQVEAALVAFRQLQADLRLQLPGLQSRLLQRPVTPGTQQTWMEVHSWPQGATPLDDWPAVIEHLARPLPGSQRHVEIFEPLA